MIPFLKKYFRSENCPKFSLPKDAFGVKVRLSDIDADERADRYISKKEYCDLITQPEYINSSCVVMSDAGRLPCRPDCIYLDEMHQEKGKNSLNLLCHIMELTKLERLITFGYSNLEKIIDAGIYINNENKKLPYVYDIFAKQDYDLREKFKFRDDSTKPWEFDNGVKDCIKGDVYTN